MAIQGLEFDKPTLVDGGHEQKAIVNTASGKQHVNTPTVEDIQKIAKGIAEKEAEAASATEWEKSVKDHLYEEDGYVVAKSSYGLLIYITDIARGITIGTDIYNDALCLNFEGQLELGLSDRSNMYIDVNEQEIGCTSVRCEYITDSETDGVVYAENLLDGNRIYRHSISVVKSPLSIQFVFYNSSPEAITSIADLEEMVGATIVGSGCRYVDGNGNSHVAAIEDVAGGEIDVVYEGGVSSFDNTSTYYDDVSQC